MSGRAWAGSHRGLWGTSRPASPACSCTPTRPCGSAPERGSCSHITSRSWEQNASTPPATHQVPRGRLCSPAEGGGQSGLQTPPLPQHPKSLLASRETGTEDRSPLATELARALPACPALPRRAQLLGVACLPARGPAEGPETPLSCWERHSFVLQFCLLKKPKQSSDSNGSPRKETTHPPPRQGACDPILCGGRWEGFPPSPSGL